MYVPTLTFGYLLTSSNFDDTQKKTTGGRNGLGAKLANIFSLEFNVETVDSERKLKVSVDRPYTSPLPHSGFVGLIQQG